MFKEFLLELIGEDIRNSLIGQANKSKSIPILTYIAKEQLDDKIPFDLFLVYSKKNGFSVYIIANDEDKKIPRLFTPKQGNNGSVFVLIDVETLQPFIAKLEVPKKYKEDQDTDKIQYTEHFNKLYIIQETVKNNQRDIAYPYIDLIAGSFITLPYIYEKEDNHGLKQLKRIDNQNTYVSIMPKGYTLSQLFSQKTHRHQHQIKHLIDQIAYLSMLNMFFSISYLDGLLQNTLGVFDENTKLWNLKICDFGVKTLYVGACPDADYKIVDKFVGILADFFQLDFDSYSTALNHKITKYCEIKNINPIAEIISIHKQIDVCKNEEDNYQKNFYKNKLLTEKQQLNTLFNGLSIKNMLGERCSYSYTKEMCAELDCIAKNNTQNILNNIDELQKHNSLLGVQYLFKIIEYKQKTDELSEQLNKISDKLNQISFQEFHKYAMEIIPILNKVNENNQISDFQQIDQKQPNQYDDFENKIQKFIETVKNVLSNAQEQESKPNCGM